MLQPSVTRVAKNIYKLGKLKQQGYMVSVLRTQQKSGPVYTVTVETCRQKEKTGEWFAIFRLKMDSAPPAMPSLDEIDIGDMVRIDVNILKYAYDLDGTSVESLDLTDERDRLEQSNRNSH